MEKIKKFADAWKMYNTKNDWVNCKKLPIIIKAIQMEMPFAVETLEGTTYEGKAGDYLLEGVEREVYPCKKGIFESTYITLDVEKKILKLKESISTDRGLFDGDMPMIAFSRHTTWNGEPCHFCNSKEGIKEVQGRYISETEFEDLKVIFFCGDCHEKLDYYFEMEMT